MLLLALTATLDISCCWVVFLSAHHHPTLTPPLLIINRDVSTIQSFTSNLPLVGCLIPATNTGRSLGLSYHLADVWLPELRKVVVAGAGSSGSATAPPPAASLQALLEPFVGVMQHSGEAALINRIRWVGCGDEQLGSVCACVLCLSLLAAASTNTLLSCRS